MYLNAKRGVKIWVTVAGCAITLIAATVSATGNDLCGTTVVTDLTLDHDLVCTGNALVAGADGVRIDLAGHTITGSGSGAGVLIVGRQGVWVTGGQIENFTAGVLVNNSSGVVVKHMTFTGNGEGIDLQAGARGTTIKESAFYNNRARGVMMRTNSLNNIVKENSFAGNNLGVALNGTVGATVKENVILSGRAAGVRVNVPASRNLVAENTIDGNPSGIDFPLTGTAWATNNAFKENRISNNACGIKGPTDGNLVSENIFTLNGSDICP
jgi:nitrous oxidase accessory protein NosD